jgi:hypothetical protein
MAEYEELKITVTLVDNARAQLKEYQETMKNIASGPAGSQMETLTRKTDVLKSTLKSLGLEAKGTGELVQKLAEGFGSAAGRVAQLGAAVVIATDQVGRMAAAMQDTSRAAQLMGTTLGHMKNIQEQLARYGISEENSAKLTAAAINAHLEAARRGHSQFFEDLMKALPKDVETVQQYRRELAKEGSPEDYLRIRKHFEDELEAGIRKRMKGQAEAEIQERVAYEKRRARETEGFNDEFAKIKEINNETEEHAKFWSKVDENSKTAADNWHAIWADFNKIYDLFKADLFDPNSSPFPLMLEKAKNIADSILQIFEEGEKKFAGKSFWEKFFYIDPKIIEFLRNLTGGRPAGGEPEGTAGTGGGAVPLMSNYASLATGTETGDLAGNTRELKKLNDNLYDLLHPLETWASPEGSAVGETPAPGDTTREGGSPRATEPSIRTGPRSADAPPPPKTAKDAPPSTPTPTPPATGGPPSTAIRPDVFPMGRPHALLPPEGIPPPAHFVYGSGGVGTSGPGGGGSGDLGDNPTFEKGGRDIPPNLLGFLRGVASTETDFTTREAYSEALNKPINNANVRDFGYARGADHGFYQMNAGDVSEGESLGMPHSMAEHLHGYGKGGQSKSSFEDQTYSAATFLARKHPDAVKKLIEENDFAGMQRAVGKKWFGPLNKPQKAALEHTRVREAARVSGAGAAIGGGLAEGQTTGGSLFQAGPSVSDLTKSRQKIDENAGQAPATTRQQRIDASGEIRVEVPNPRPNSSALFNRTPMKRGTQMAPADQGPDEPARSTAPGQ